MIALSPMTSSLVSVCTNPGNFCNIKTDFFERVRGKEPEGGEVFCKFFSKELEELLLSILEIQGV